MWTPVERFFEFSLLGLLASGYFAVLTSGFLDWPTAVFAGLGLILRLLIILGRLRFDPPARAVSILTLLYFGFYPLDYGFLSRDFVRATVHLIFFLAIVRGLTARTPRDYTYVKVLAFLELLAACIVTANSSFFFFLMLFLLFGVATFASSEIRRAARKDYRPRDDRTLVTGGGMHRFHLRLGTLSACLFAGILLMTAGLFFLLPRTAQAAFRHLVPQHYHLAGFSNEVILGQIGEIKTRDTPVMHVQMFDMEAARNLKWRGGVLSRFDGRKWSNPPVGSEALRVVHGQVDLGSRTVRYRQGGRHIPYEVHLKDIAADALFLAGEPEYLRIDAPFIVRGWANSYRLGFLVPPVVYHVSAFFETDPQPPGEFHEPESLPLSARGRYLELPPIDPRIRPLAVSMAGSEILPERQARALERHLRTDFSYTLQMPSQEVADPLAYFLFERRKGHCEYFASAMAVMLRTLDIPSRVVTGFQSGVYNPISGWQVIRASDAHSWVEAYIPGRGWVTFDPTPADPTAVRQNFWAKLALWADAVDLFWQDWVLNYNLDRQFSVAVKVEESSRGFLSVSWFDRAASQLSKAQSKATGLVVNWWPYFVAAFFLGLLIYFEGGAIRKLLSLRWRLRRIRSGSGNASDATLLYERMLAVLRKRGFEKPAWLTPLEFAQVLPASDLAPLVAEFTAAYNQLRFGNNAEDAQRIVTLLSRIEQR